jgi:hypothetical protein
MLWLGCMIFSNSSAPRLKTGDPDMFDFTLLPTELKLNVLRRRLILPIGFTARKHASHSRRALIPLVLTSKAMRQLALEVYYGENTFIVTHNQSWFGYPKPAIGTWLRTLTVAIHAVQVKGLVPTRHFSRHVRIVPWCRLLIDDCDQKSRSSTSWQTNLPNLTNLEINVQFIDTKCFENSLWRVINDMEQKRIAIKTSHLR